MHKFFPKFFTLCFGLFCALASFHTSAWASLFSSIELKDYSVLAVEGLSDTIEGENIISFSQGTKKLVTLIVGQGPKEEFAKQFTEKKYAHIMLNREEVRFDNNSFTAFTAENKEYGVRSFTLFAADGHFLTVTTHTCAPHLPYMLYGIDSTNASLKNIFRAIALQKAQTDGESWEAWLSSPRKALPKFHMNGPVYSERINFAGLPYMRLEVAQNKDWTLRQEKNFVVISPKKGSNESDLWVSIVPYSTPQGANLNEHFYEKMYYALRNVGMEGTTRGRYYGGEYAFYTPTGGIGNASLVGDYALITVQNTLGCSSQMADYFTKHLRKIVEHLPLMQAIEKGDVLSVKNLVQSGIDINFPLNGFTPLATAAQKNALPIMQLLLEHGAHVEGNTKAHDNITPLSLAVLENHVDATKLLLKHKAQVNHTKTSPLIHAMMGVFKDKSELVQMLLDHGANPNGSEHYGFNPTQFAVRGARVKYLPMLLAKGANLQVRDQYQKTLLMLIAEQYPTDDGLSEEDKRKTMQFLIDNKADMHAVDESGKTALMYAAAFATKENVEVLLKNGANPHMKDEQGRTALYYAKRSPQKGVMAMLRKYGAKE